MRRPYNNCLGKGIRFLVAMAFLVSVVFPPRNIQAQTVLNLPKPGTLITVSPVFHPPMIVGITLYPNDPFRFDFIIDVGDQNLGDEEFKKESEKLIHYFLTALTVPEDEMWVNLSPYEKDRIVADGLSQTEMGRDMLVQDYLLKQLTASLMYPEGKTGKDFWEAVYSKTEKMRGATEMPVDTFNKVWIVPDKASVYLHQRHVFVNNSHLKVMLEEDYLAMNGEESFSGPDHEASQELLRTHILPPIEQEVNEGKTFSTLRQIYSVMILATWYKRNFAKGSLGKVYVDQNKINGIDLKDKQIKEKVYKQYLEAFQKGVFNYIKEEYDPAHQAAIPRKYFSGGLTSPGEIPTMRGKISSSPLSDRPHRTVAVNLVGTTINKNGNSPIKMAGRRVQVNDQRVDQDFVDRLELALRVQNIYDERKIRNIRVVSGDFIEPVLLMSLDTVIISEKILFLQDDIPSPKIIRPVKDANTLNQKKVDRWVSSQTSNTLRETARYLANHIQYVSQSEFEGALRNLVKQFNDRMQYRKFIVLSHNKHEKDGNKRKSDLWTYYLAREMGLPEPVAIVTHNEIDEYLLRDPNIDIVIIDDVAYSGAQVADDYFISGYKGAKNNPIHYLIPFMSRLAQQVIQNVDANNQIFYSYQEILRLDDILSRHPPNEDVFSAMETLFHLRSRKNVRSLTYFQHKVPDEASFLSILASNGDYEHSGVGHILSGPMISLENPVSVRKSIRLIDAVTPPYKVDSFPGTSVDILPKENTIEEHLDSLENIDVHYEKYQGESRIDGGSPDGTEHIIVQEREGGKLWLAKRYPDHRLHRAFVDKFVADISQQIGMDKGVDVRLVKDRGKVVSLVEWKEHLMPLKDLLLYSSHADYGDNPNDFVSQLYKSELKTLVRQQALDWLVSNHDAHSGHFLRGEGGGIAAVIDKSQAFKYIGNNDEKLSVTYNPNEEINSDMVEYVPIYNLILPSIFSGEARLSKEEAWQEVREVIAKIESIDDNVYLRILKPYADFRFDVVKGYEDEEKTKDNFLQLALERKKNIREDFEIFYDRDEISSPVGGIDLSPKILDLTEEGMSFHFTIDDKMVNSIQPNLIRGLVPVILNVTPTVNIHLLLGLKEESEDYPS